MRGAGGDALREYMTPQECVCFHGNGRQGWGAMIQGWPDLNGVDSNNEYQCTNLWVWNLNQQNSVETIFHLVMSRNVDIDCRLSLRKHFFNQHFRPAFG
jgi:hypothetical protein